MSVDESSLWRCVGQSHPAFHVLHWHVSVGPACWVGQLCVYYQGPRQSRYTALYMLHVCLMPCVSTGAPLILRRIKAALKVAREGRRFWSL